MMKTLNLLVPALVLSGGIALALYAHPRTYRDLTPAKVPKETMPNATVLTNSGTIRGTVRWPGHPPNVPVIEGMLARLGEGPTWRKARNPAVPRIVPWDRGIANAVVYLKKVGNERKQWPYAPAVVRATNDRIVVRQGGTESSIGFIPLGGEAEIVSEDPGYQMLRARDAAYFTQPLPRPNQPIRRSFAHAGRVAFTSAVGHVWHEADLFVCEHPYYAKTNEDGKFELTDVPPGEYEVVAWLKNWNILSKDRDPETGKIMRLNFDKPFTTTKSVTVVEGQTATVELTLP